MVLISSLVKLSVEIEEPETNGMLDDIHMMDSLLRDQHVVDYMRTVDERHYSVTCMTVNIQNLTLSGVEAIEKMFFSPFQVHRLKLFRSPLLLSMVPWLSKIIHHPSNTLMALDIWVHSDSGCLDELWMALSQTRRIKTLVINNGPPTKSFSRCMAQIIAVNQSIRNLQIFECHDVLEICDALQKNKTIQKFEISSGRHVDEEGTMHLLDVLRRNTFLVSIYVNTMLREVGPVLEMLRHNPIIEHIHLNHALNLHPDLNSILARNRARKVEARAKIISAGIGLFYLRTRLFKILIWSFV